MTIYVMNLQAYVVIHTQTYREVGNNSRLQEENKTAVFGILKNRDLLANDQIVAPELVAYEVTNAIWKHKHLLKDLENGKPYISIFNRSSGS